MPLAHPCRNRAGDTALAAELNFALALKTCRNVESVDFAIAWGHGHTQAKRTAPTDENFIVRIGDRH